MKERTGSRIKGDGGCDCAVQEPAIYSHCYLQLVLEV